MSKRVCVIGGVAGGASAAARLRRLCETCTIKVFERGPFASFANCGMPYRVGGVIQDDKKLLVATPELFRNRFNIDVLTRHEVLKIDRTAKKLTIKNLNTDEVFEEPYDKVILAPGAAPIRPPLPGIDLEGIYILRNIPDMQQIMARLDKIQSKENKRALVVGGGFIGLEMAENLVHRGVSVTLLELAPHVMPMLSDDLANDVQMHMREKGVEIITSDGVTGFELDDEISARTSSGKVIKADIVVLSIGVKPEVELAKAAGLELGVKGSIKTNDQMLTADPDIFAVGDAVETSDCVVGERTNVPLAGPANRQGRLVADVIMGHDAHFRGVQGTAVCKVFDKTIAFTGATPASLARNKIDYLTINAHPGHHVSYYPGAKEMHMKLFFGKDGKVLGVQAVGTEGVERRVDVIAMAIQLGAKVQDLAQAELCYAPQFGAAKDPVNMLGFIASNALAGITPLANWDEVPHITEPDITPTDPEKPIVIDVRNPDEYAAQHIPGALNIPLETLRANLDRVPKDRKKVYLTCQAGQRSHYAIRVLRQVGFDVLNLAGGMTTYCLREGVPVKRP